MKERLNRIWLSCSLSRKFQIMSIIAVVLVLLSIGTNMLVAVIGIGGFGNILKSNSQSVAFWSAVETERQAFTGYVDDDTEENRLKYEQASAGTTRALKALPFQYRTIGAPRYARTWSIHNLYETYENAKEGFFQLGKDDPSYTEELYHIYRIQNYLSSYAGNLEQLTVEMGTGQYEKQKPLFVLVPLFSILWGGIVFFMVWRLKHTVNQSIIRPVIQLAEDSVRVGENDFSVPDIRAEGEDEIAHLVRAFCSMKASTQGYITALNEKHEMEKQLEAVRLQLLKNQINPHFLFNTLNMIAGTAQIEDAAATEKMITALSRLFRYNLKSTDSVMPLERELMVVEDYMYLQQMRFGQRVRFTRDCSEDTLDILVPTFALQPLVENAILHGLSSKSQGGRIHIRSRLSGGRLLISVADTGVGIPAERLEEIRKALETGEETKTGVGVGNIYRRVHSMYQDGQVQICSRKGCGTVVLLLFTAE